LKAALAEKSDIRFAAAFVDSRINGEISMLTFRDELET
jgi:hypothetical protein